MVSTSFDGMLSVSNNTVHPIVRGDARVRFWFLMSPNFAGADLALGHLQVRWRHSSRTEEATQLLPLPRAKIQRTPFSAIIGTPACIQYLSLSCFVCLVRLHLYGSLSVCLSRPVCQYNLTRH